MAAIRKRGGTLLIVKILFVMVFALTLILTVATIPVQAQSGVDFDLDGFIRSMDGGTDCNDFDSSIFPGAPEIVNDGIDQDCDGLDVFDPNADEDNDGIPTGVEDINGDTNPANDDSDQDGFPDYLDADDDNDNILTANEDVDGDGNPANDDSDQDGFPDYLDADDDGDGIPTADEDVDGDGNPANDDSDQDGIPDYLDTVDNQPPADQDNDGVLDGDDNCVTIPNPDQNDSDEDGIGDLCDESTIEDLQTRINALEEAIIQIQNNQSDHHHTYRTGRGLGHNNSEALTSTPTNNEH